MAGWLWISTLAFAQPAEAPAWRYKGPEESGFGTVAAAYLSDRQSGTIMVTYMGIPPNMASGEVNLWLTDLPTRCRDLSHRCQLPLKGDGKPREALTGQSLGAEEDGEYQGKFWVVINNVHTSLALIHDLPHIHILSVDVGEPGQPKWLEFATGQLNLNRLGADPHKMLNKVEVKW